MNDVHLGQVDLNLLRVFDALAEEHSATGAGRRLGLSQSAVSHALRRLRQLFDDPLFVRGPEGMRSTPRAAEVAPALREALVQLQLAIAPSSFSAELTDRRFTLSTGSYVSAVLLPQLVPRLNASAPRAELRIRPLDGALEEMLSNGSVDLAVGAFTHLAEGMGREPLFEERSGWALRAGHPAAREHLSIGRLAQFEHVVVDPGIDREAVGARRRRPGFLDGGAEIEGALRRAGLERRVALRAFDFYSALAVVSRTDMVCLAPRRIVEAHSRDLGLVLLDPPYPSRAISIEAVWSRESGKHPALEWLRTMLRAVAKEV